MIYGKNHLICGLLGEKLSHSFSPMIHSRLADYSYSLFEMSESEVGKFIRSDRYFALNVTIPYKKTVMPFLDEISDEALAIGSVNTITRTASGKIRGDNTDYFGFEYLIKKSGITVKNKNVMILGTGGASLTARAVVSDMGARRISFVSRSGEINYENFYNLLPDTEVVINCTPVGMYPNNGVSPVSLERLPDCQGVVDMIYNPSSTALLLDAKRLSIPHINGLPMLVAQAKRACELFLEEKIEDSEIDRIIALIENQTKNIILVGMPGCGKSTVAELIGKALCRTVVDTDALIVEDLGRDIPSVFANAGEEFFRQAEHRAICRAGKLSGAIIATGGGAVTRAENLDPLRQNGTVFFISRDIEKLARDGRPLSLSGNLSEMYEKRLPMYRHFCDFEVSNDKEPRDCADEIIKIFMGETL